MVILLSCLLLYILNFFQLADIDAGIINLIVILFIAVRLRDYASELMSDISDIFSVVSFREMLAIVLANIFFSYGMLYLSNYIIHLVSAGSIFSWFLPVKSIGGIAGILSFISIVFISPVGEELLFRGVFMNKFRLVVPAVFAVLTSSLLFASLHGFGSIISAFVFGICMAILYLKTDNILVPILAHFINNLISEAVYNLDYLDLLFTNDIVMVLMSGLAVASFVVLLKFMMSNLKNI